MMLSCKEATKLQASSVLEKLSISQKTALRLHLAMCRACHQVNQQLQLISRAYKQWEQKLMKDDAVKLSNISKDALKEKLSDTDSSP